MDHESDNDDHKTCSDKDIVTGILVLLFKKPENAESNYSVRMKRSLVDSADQCRENCLFRGGDGMEGGEIMTIEHHWTEKN